MAKSDKKSTEEKELKEDTVEKEDNQDKEDKDQEGKSEATTEPEPEKTEEKLKELSEEEIYKLLKTFPGVGQVMAERIYKAGFDSREKLLEITIDDLKRIRGIGHSLAETIAGGMEKAIKDLEEPTKPKDVEKKEGPGIADKTIGFLKGTFSKLTSFFKGKKPQKTGATDEKKPKLDEGGEVEVADGSTKSDADEAVPGETEKYPEVSAPDTTTEPEHEHKEVQVEGSEVESDNVIPEDHLTGKPGVEPSEPEMEPKPEPRAEPKTEPEPEPKSKPESKVEPEPVPPPLPEVRININDASGLLLWFESTPGLRTEAGRLVFKAGYNNLEELKEAVVEDLILINGIDENEAHNICSKAQDL